MSKDTACPPATTSSRHFVSDCVFFDGSLCACSAYGSPTRLCACSAYGVSTVGARYGRPHGVAPTLAGAPMPDGIRLAFWFYSLRATTGYRLRFVTGTCRDTCLQTNAPIRPFARGYVLDIRATTLGRPHMPARIRRAIACFAGRYFFYTFGQKELHLF